MTTSSGNRAVTQLRQLRVHWPALLLPVLAAELIGLVHGHAGYETAIFWLAVLFALAAAASVLTPAAAARIAPFALFGYGAVGLFVAHSLLTWQTSKLFYGVLTAHAGSTPPGSWHLNLVLPEAFVIMAASVWLLIHTGGPGSGAVRAALDQLRGTSGYRRTVPALLLIPVLVLWEEAYANPLWFGGPEGWLLAVLIVVGGAALVRREPRLAAAVAVFGLIALGVVVIASAVNGADNFIGFAANGPDLTVPDNPVAAPGVFSGLYGPVLLASHDALWLVKAEGAVLIWAGGALAFLLLPRPGDADLARRAAALTQRVDRLTRTRSDATETAVAELRRIERDLHDGAQARLVAVGMSLRAAEELMRTSPEAAVALVAEARATSSRALTDLRDLVRGIYPPVLADRGLADAVRALALDAPMTVETDIALAGEPPMPIAAAVYFGIAEALTNTVRHAEARTVQVSLDHGGGLLRATVTDDGQGGADSSLGTGLAGVESRLASFDGILAVSSPPGGPTILVIEVPCALSGHAPARPARSA